MQGRYHALALIEARQTLRLRDELMRAKVLRLKLPTSKVVRWTPEGYSSGYDLEKLEDETNLVYRAYLKELKGVIVKR